MHMKCHNQEKSLPEVPNVEERNNNPPNMKSKNQYSRDVYVTFLWILMYLNARTENDTAGPMA